MYIYTYIYIIPFIYERLKLTAMAYPVYFEWIDVSAQEEESASNKINRKTNKFIVIAILA